MTWAAEDVTDTVADRCVEEHTEARLDCSYCPTRLDLKICARCETEIWPHETCPDCVDEPSLLVDGFGSALVVPLPGVGKAAA